MDTGALATVVVAGVLVVGYFAWRRAANRLYFPGGAIPLEPSQRYEFVFIASFGAEDAARSCVRAAEPLGIGSKVFPPSEHQRTWSVHWELVSKPEGARIRRLETNIKATVLRFGGRFVDLAVSKPGATISADAG